MELEKKLMKGVLRIKRKRIRVNEKIYANEIRLIDSNKNQVGIVTVPAALRLAEEVDLDLVEISPNAKPPVCKIIDIGKYKYDLQKKANKAKKKQKTINLKEIKLRPVTEIHDYNFKIKNAQKFLSKGDKVKFTVLFKGREMQHTHLGHELMQRIINDTNDLGKVEVQPKFEGRQIIMIVQPL